MKATGIVRRIDDLGRVVVPKEIRRVLRIREGDPLEIYTGNSGEVILKKYSPIHDLSQFADEYAESAVRILGGTILVSDTDHVPGEQRKRIMLTNALIRSWIRLSRAKTNFSMTKKSWSPLFPRAIPSALLPSYQRKTAVWAMLNLKLQKSVPLFWQNRWKTEHPSPYIQGTAPPSLIFISSQEQFFYCRLIIPVHPEGLSSCWSSLSKYG